MEQQITSNDVKNQIITTKAINLITDHPEWTNQQIANTLGISRTTLWNMINNEYGQILLKRRLNEVEDTLYQWIQELHESKSLTDKREAAKLLLAVGLKLADKIRPTITQTQNININTTLQEIEQHQKRHQIHQETISRLPPTMRNLYNQTLQQVQQEWETT